MNQVETWLIDYAEDVKTEVNRYCRQHNLNPISISITYLPLSHSFLVGLVVEQGE